MTDPIDNLFRDIKDARLTPNERAIMRNNLEFFAAEYPARAPFGVRFADALSGYASGSQFRYSNVGAFAMALVLVIGVGTSYASTGALPGDALYGIKVGVAEPLQGVFALDSEAKAKWNTIKVIRRLEEAEALAASGRLTPVARAEIEAHINKTTNEFDAAIVALAKQDDSAKIAEIQSDLEASLVGHADVLIALSTDLPESEPTLSKILATVQTRADISKTARTYAEATVAANNDDTVRKVAIQKKDAASSALNRIRAKVNFAKAAATASTTLDATSTAITAEEAIMVGEQKLEQGEYAEALNTFQAVIRAAQTAEVQISAEERLKTGVGDNAAAGASINYESSTELRSLRELR